MLEKARTISVDEVVVDLEDAVATEVKARARSAAVAALRDGFAARSVAVRINAIGSAFAEDDLAELAAGDVLPDSLVVPKVESAHDLETVGRALSETPDSLRLQALVETARSLRAIDDIAAGSTRLDSLILGYADLAASLGRSRSGAADLDLWLSVQDTVLSAARAAGIEAIDGPYLAIEDETGLRSAAMRAANLGFDGKWAIHPRQLVVIMSAFIPSADEVARARAIVDAAASATEHDLGAVRYAGQMVDEAVRLTALRTLQRAEAGLR